MRFEDLASLTSLPIQRLRDQFRYELVLTVLPVRTEQSSRETLLVATPTMLAMLTAVPFPKGAWMTQWAPWDIVGFAAEEETMPANDETYALRVYVGNRRYHAHLEGEAGKLALRDFVITVQARRSTAGVGHQP